MMAWLLAVLLSSSWNVETREYPGYVEGVYDGDTVTLSIDLGFGVLLYGQKARLYGINAPEVRGQERLEGIASRDWLWRQVAEKPVRILAIQRKNRYGQSYEAKGKYGRWLVILMLGDRDMNEELVDQGFAEEKEY